jgi:aminoglycoside phosphotransferase (APT) family kinase protein
MEPWQADWNVDADLAKKLIDAQFPQFSAQRIQPLGEGWDNAAFSVGDAVFRFPRRKDTVELLEHECVILPQLGRLPLAVPQPTWIGRPTEEFPSLFVGYPRLVGESAEGLDDSLRADCAEPLGRFLAALHAMAPPPGLPGDQLGRLDVAARSAGARQRALRLGVVVDRWLDVPPPSLGRERVVVHGDLYTRHLLVHAGVLSGVLDWGDVHLGDRAVDLSVAWSFLPPGARPHFCRAYGRIDDESWRLAHFRALTHTLAVAVYADGIGDHRLGAEARRALGYLACQ